MERKSGGDCPSVRPTRDGAILYAVPNDRSVKFRPSPLRMRRLVGSAAGSSQLRSGHHQPIQQGPAWFKKAHPSLLPGSWLSPAPSTGQPASAPGCQFNVARHLAQDRISGEPIGTGFCLSPQTRSGTPDEAHGTTDAEASSVTSRADMVRLTMTLFTPLSTA